VISRATFDDPSALQDWTTELLARLNQEADGAARYKIELQPAADGAGIARLHISKDEHGSRFDRHLTRDFFDSPEYQRIAELSRTLAGLIEEGAYVKRGESRHEIDSFKQAIDWLFEHAKRGQTIQRYKGLGEMNPDQLWETTINPETRRLMQVRIEDAVAADEVFTTLMGDEVEPRREFIEKNALSVANLDV
jgi:DNA gyrase subunit B